MYFEQRFSLPWSDDHIEAIRLMESVARDNECFAIAMPRGAGKTTLCEVLAMFAILSGLHQFVTIIAANKDCAAAMLESIKTELETNALLAEDFPEVCRPIRALEGISHRCRGQTHEGASTGIIWRGDMIAMPQIRPPWTGPARRWLRCSRTW